MPASIKLIEHKVNENDSDISHYIISGIETEHANAIRRTLLSNVPCVVMNNIDCVISINHTQYHDQLIADRLGLIPVMSPIDIVENSSGELTMSNKYVDKYAVVIDVENTGDIDIYVTTEMFKVKNIETGEFLSESETRRLFPPNKITGQYVHLIKLRHKVGDNISGEHLVMECKLTINKAKYDGRFNVVSKSISLPVRDVEAGIRAWDVRAKELAPDVASGAVDLDVERKNFFAVEAHRYIRPSMYEIVIGSIGIYENDELFQLCCILLKNDLRRLLVAVDSDVILITKSEVIMSGQPYDVILEDNSLTLGRLLKYHIYESHCRSGGGKSLLNFVGFNQPHISSERCILRMCFADESAEKKDVKAVLRQAIGDAVAVFDSMEGLI